METLVVILWGLLWLFIAIVVSWAVSKSCYTHYRMTILAKLQEGIEQSKLEHRHTTAKVLERLSFTLEKINTTMNSLSEHMRDISDRERRD